MYYVDLHSSQLKLQTKTFPQLRREGLVYVICKTQPTPYKVVFNYVSVLQLNSCMLSQALSCYSPNPRSRARGNDAGVVVGISGILWAGRGGLIF